MTVCTTYAWKRRDLLRTHKVVLMAMTLIAGDDTVTVATGLKKIYSYSVSPPAITAKPVDYATVTGGTITIHTTNPAAAMTLYVKATGI